MSHSIVFGQPSGDLLSVPCSVVTWSDVGFPDCSGGGNNLSADPLLDATYRPQAGSPCLDRGPDTQAFAGAPCYDAAGDLRVRDFDGDGIARLDTGAYEPRNPARSPAEVDGLQWPDDATLSWAAVPEAVEYHVYRSPIVTLSYGYSGDCRDDLDGDRSDTSLADGELPAPAGGFSYLITAAAGGAEGSLGAACCAERSRYAPCP